MATLRTSPLAGILLLLTTFHSAIAADATYVSHAPVRPLPVASSRAMGEGPKWFVDAAKGDDAAAGSAEKPWKSLTFALTQLKPGDTLYLRGGTYYESPTVRAAGASDKRITIRSCPGELAILDGGYREFYEDPAHAWEPFAGGADGEYVSTKSYSSGGGFGNFGDSMLPFQRYLFISDLRSTNEFERKELGNRAEDPVGIYAGPGTFRDIATGKIHIRLSHTKLEGLGDNAYTGETDPRKLPLVIGGTENTLNVQGATNVTFQDIVIRGATKATVRMEAAQQIEFDGVTIYAGGAAVRTGKVDGLKFVNCALRGFGAPWHSRFLHKDRSGSGYLFMGNGSNFEFANCEMTDHHDGFAMHEIDGLKIHHSFIENFNDDALEPGPKKEHEHVEIYCNYISRCLSTFTAHGNPTPITGEPGSGVYIYRNVIDLSRGTYYGPPMQADPTGAFYDRATELALTDHKSPTQQNFYVYQNTILTVRGGWRDLYAFGWGARTVGTTRRVLNNIFVQSEGLPGGVFGPTAIQDDVEADHNLFWSLKDGPAFKGDVFAKFHASKMYQESKSKYAPGWTTNDQFADPKFAAFKGDAKGSTDLRPQPGSPAIAAGAVLPEAWPDPVRPANAGKPDLGALPSAGQPWTIGINGRMTPYGTLIAK